MSKNPKEILLDVHFAGQQQNMTGEEKWGLLMAYADDRTREVADYIDKAIKAELGELGKGGSLKFVLWWLRDNLPAMEYETAAAAAIKAALEFSWPLDRALHHLKRCIALSAYAEEMENAPSKEELAAGLDLRKVGELNVAYNNTPRNLKKAAFAAGADVYVSVTQKGTLISARRGMSFDGLSPEWQQPYPNLALRRDILPLPRVMALLPQVVR